MTSLTGARRSCRRGGVIGRQDDTSLPDNVRSDRRLPQHRDRRPAANDEASRPTLRELYAAARLRQCLPADRIRRGRGDGGCAVAAARRPGRSATQPDGQNLRPERLLASSADDRRRHSAPGDVIMTSHTVSNGSGRVRGPCVNVNQNNIYIAQCCCQDLFKKLETKTKTSGPWSRDQDL